MLTITLPKEQESIVVLLHEDQKNDKCYEVEKQVQSREDDPTRPRLFEARWLGETMEGIVHKNETVIVKRVNAKHNSRELNALQELMSNQNPHLDFFPNVITTVRLPSSDYIDIVMKHGGVDLFTHFFEQEDIWVEAVVNARITQTVKTLSHAMCCLIKLHALDMYHGDIKPENFVLDPVLQKVQMIDFECACKSKIPKNQRAKLVSMPMCTLLYSHPRICAGALVDGFQADLWSFGQMTFALYVGRSLLDIPCETERIMRQNAFYYNHNWAGLYSKLFPRHVLNHPTFELFVDFVNLLCNEHNMQRPPRADMMLLQHPFLCSWRTPKLPF